MFDGAGTELCWLLGDGSFQLAIFDCLEAIKGAIKSHHLDLRTGPRPQSFDRAERHFIVLCKDGLNIRVGLQQVGSDVKAFRAVEIRRLLADDPNVPVPRNLLFKALTALARGGGTSGALQDEDIALFPDGLGELSAACAPPATLSEATMESSSTPLTSRSTPMTGTPSF